MFFWDRKIQSLVKSESILLSPLHIKMALLKNYVKVMDCNGDAFTFFKENFPKISKPDIKAGIFV